MPVPTVVSTTARARRAARWLACVGMLLLGARQARAQSPDGFTFGQPAATLSIRGGFDHANAGSDVFSESTRLFSLSRGSFSGATLAADLGIRATRRVDVVLGVGFSGSSAGSHYRDLVANDDSEIEQTTSFRRIPMTASLKAYLVPRGRAVGSLAWIPAKLTPYVGAGGGVMYYRFAQTGDFVDYQTNDVFSGDVRTTGWTPTAHGFAGVDYSLSPHFALTGEARYTWARGAAGQDFEGYDRVDLSGVAATAGLTIRF